MSVIYALKILALSHMQSDKDYFFSHNGQVTGFSSNYKAVVGVNIFAASLLVNTSGEMVTLSIWDIDSDIPTELKEPFYKGAAGCLLFCSSQNISNLNSLNSIISDVREIAGTIPIFLVVNKEGDSEVSIQTIETYTEKLLLKDYYILPDGMNEILATVSRGIIYNQYKISSKNLAKWIRKKEQEFDDFSSYFKRCPCCNIPLHESYLRSFFFSQDSKKSMLKKRLLKLRNNSTQFNIRIGIPCCSCFEKYFS